VPARLDRLAGGELLTTVLQNFLFHVKVGEQWAAIGYWVGPLVTNSTERFAVGRLYRYATNVSPVQVRAMASMRNDEAQLNGALTAFKDRDARFGRSAPVVDGIVHLRVIAYRADGIPLYGTNLLGVERDFDRYKSTLSAAAAADAAFATVVEPVPGESVQYLFSDLSFPQAPAMLEIEMGIIEPQLLKQYTSIAEAQPAEGGRFLARNAGKIHLFRQRIPLRNAPPFR
jgi:hypothetical protein